MKHELKVIMGDTAHNTLVLLDNEPVGCIQEVSFHAQAGEDSTKIVLVFPNLMECPGVAKSLVDELQKKLEILKEMPHVGVILQPVW